MKLIIVGGHLSPALAVLEALPKDADVLFIGRKYTFEGDMVLSLEYREINKRKIPFAEVSTGRLQRKFTRYTIPSLFKIPYGFIQAFFILVNFKPDVVLSFGGYLSIPVGISAFLLGIPLVIHEQTLSAGLSNRILSFFAKKICISWETSKKYFPKDKTVFTGNPVRKFLLSSRPSPKGAWRDLLHQHINAGDSSTPFHFARNDASLIYITGGSGGSHFINTLVEGCLAQLLEKFIIIHQTGDAQEYRDFERLKDLKDSLPVRLKARYQITKFVEPQEVGAVLQRADLVVGRSGINTVTELMFFKKPSILIPLPYSQNNEQIKNALFLKNQGLGEVFYQTTSDVAKGKSSSFELLKVIETMIDNIDKYRAKYKLSELLKKEAGQKIVEVIYYEAKVKKN